MGEYKQRGTFFITFWWKFCTLSKELISWLRANFSYVLPQLQPAPINWYSTPPVRLIPYYSMRAGTNLRKKICSLDRQLAEPAHAVSYTHLTLPTMAVV